MDDDARDGTSDHVLPRRRSGDASASSADIAILVAQGGQQRVGFLAHDVVEIQRMVAWEPLPGAPEAVDGIIDLRGRVIPVLDVNERFGLPSRPPRIDDHLVVVRSGRRLVAVRVEQALHLESVPTGDLLPVEEVAPGGARVTGVVRSDGSLLVVADLDAFLGWEEAAVLDRALAEQAQRHG